MAQQAPSDLILMAGQSNMAGHKVGVDDLADTERGLIEGARIWADGAWVPLAVDAGYQKRGFGPELSFARQWQDQTGRPLSIVKLAKGGSYLSRGWSAEGRGGPLYQRLVSEVRAAMATEPVRLRGLVWMQGESDALDLEDAKAYAARFEAFVARLRQDLGVPDLPIVAGLISAPGDHVDLVRDAMASAALTAFKTVETRDLAHRPDGIHLTASGLAALGQRCADALSSFEDTALIRQWLWNSGQYHAWYEGETVTPKGVVISLPHAVADNGFAESGFGQRFFRKRGTPVVYVRARMSNWFQDDEVFDVAKAIRAFIPKETKVVTYGASMGAYGGLLLSGALAADRVLAVAPQYSIDRAIVPWEKRWSKAAKRIDGFVHRMEDHVSPTAQKLVFYDPLNADRNQIALFDTDDTWSLIKIPLASHQVAQRLLDSKSLSLLFNGLFDDGPPVNDIRKAARARRRDSKIYWLTLANKSAERRPGLALYAIDRCLEVGGPKWKLKKLRETLSARETT